MSITLCIELWRWSFEIFFLFVKNTLVTFYLLLAKLLVLLLVLELVFSRQMSLW